MVPAHSHKVSRVSWYSGYRHVNSSFAYGAFTLSGWLSQNHSARLIESIIRSEPRSARTPVWALPLSLAATHRITCCFLFLWVLRCFTSPRSLYPPYIFRRESLGRHAAQRGFPIRTPSDQNSLISSPRLIADCYVLLRLQMPRHPPFALKDLKSHEFIKNRKPNPKVRFEID